MVNNDDCLNNTKMLVAHDERLKFLDSQLMKMENNQTGIIENLNIVREKLFDGYDTKIVNINQRVMEILDSLNDLKNREHLNKQDVSDLIDYKLLTENRADSKVKDKNRKWHKNHRAELLSGFAAIGVLILGVLQYLGR